MFLPLHPLSFCSLFIITLLVCKYLFGYPKSSRLPPGSFGWLPFVGWTLSFIAQHVSSSRGRFLDYNIKRYGKIFRTHVFGHRTIISCDAEFNHFILNNEDRLVVSSYPKNIPGVLGDLTLLVITGDVHKRLRGAALNFFASMKSYMAACLSDIEENALRILDSWKGKDAVVFAAEARKFTFGVIIKETMSLGHEDPETQEILENFVKFMKGFVSVPIYLPGTSYAKAIHANRRIKNIAGMLLDRREASEREITERKTDFLDILLAHKELSREERVSLVIDLLFGGYETTSSLLAILVRCLADNPRALNTLKEEHEAVRRAKGDGEGLEWEDFQKMQFTQCVIKEGLRFGNVVKFVHRETIKPIRYKGYDIPVGWKLLPVLAAAHLDPSLYPDPLEFDPWRWQGNTGSLNSFMPFGGGTRLCPGSDLGRLKASFFLHHLVLRYTWTPLYESDLPMSFPYLDFKNGLQISIKPLPRTC